MQPTRPRHKGLLRLGLRCMESPGREISARAILAQAEFGSSDAERSVRRRTAGQARGLTGRRADQLIEAFQAAVDQRIILLVLSGIAHDLEANEQFHIARRSAGSVHADALRPDERAEVAPILDERILCGALVVQTGLFVGPDRDRSAGGSPAACADVKLRRPTGARCALSCDGNCSAYDTDGESSHDVLVSIGVSQRQSAAGGSNLSRPHAARPFADRKHSRAPAGACHRAGQRPDLVAGDDTQLTQSSPDQSQRSARPQDRLLSRDR